MDTKEEMIEEIDVMEDLSTDIKEDKETKLEEVKPDIPVVEPVIEEVVSPSENKVEEMTINKSDEENVSVEPEIIDSNDENQDVVTEEMPKKNKTPLIVLLSVLLVLDIAALVIYMIGIEKVISFIK